DGRDRRLHLDVEGEPVVPVSEQSPGPVVAAGHRARVRRTQERELARKAVVDPQATRRTGARVVEPEVVGKGVPAPDVRPRRGLGDREGRGPDERGRLGDIEHTVRLYRGDRRMIGYLLQRRWEGKAE